MFCKEDLSNIEGYDEAISSKDTYVCHHRLETHDRWGNLRDEPIPSIALKIARVYCNRPAKELIFMSMTEHSALHAHLLHKGKKLSEETRKRISDNSSHHPSWIKGKKAPKPYWCNNGRYSTRYDGVNLPEGFVEGRLTFNNNGGFKKGNIPWNKYKAGEFHHSEETKQQISNALKGREPWNKGKKMEITRKVSHWKLVDGKRVWYK